MIGDCGNADVTSVVRSPDGQEYHCSTVKPGTPGSIRISEWYEALITKDL